MVVIEHSRSFSERYTSAHALLCVLVQCQFPKSIFEPIFYEWSRGTGAMSAVRNVNSALGEDTTTVEAVNRWFTRFTKEDTDFEDKHRSERLQAMEDAAVLDTVKEDPKANTRRIAKGLECTQSRAVIRLPTLGYRKVLTQWIPHTLSMRFTRTSIYQSLLLSSRKTFLEGLVTGDDT